MAGIGETRFVDGWYSGNDLIGWHKLRDLSQEEASGGGGIGTNWQRDMASGEARINNAISTAQQGIGVAGAGAGAMRGDAASMRGQAALVNSQGNAVNRDADALAALVPKLDPYAQKLGGYGDDLAALGKSLSEQAKDVFGQGGALVNLDPTKGGLSAEFIKQYGYLSPDRYVSRATSDVQSSFENAEQQMGRQNARRGVFAGSGAGMALRQQLDRALAVARAAAKTNARQQGIDEQTKMLSTMTDAANTLYNMGKDTQSAALQATGAAGDMQKGAAGVVQAQGGLLGDAGKLRATAGQLFGSAADIFGGAAKIEGGAAELELSALKNLQTAYSSAADYYLNVGRQGISGSGGGGTIVQTVPGVKTDLDGNIVPF